MSYAPAITHIIDGIYTASLSILRHQDRLADYQIDGALQAFEITDMLLYRNPAGEVSAAQPSLSDLYQTLTQKVILEDVAVGIAKTIEPQKFARAVHFLRQRRHDGHRTVIISREGTCRAPVYVTAYMLQEARLSLRDAFARVKTQRTRIGLSLEPKAWQSLLTHYGQPYTVENLWQWLDTHS